MKEKLEGLTPLEMDRIEKSRLSLEEAQDMANMIITKFEGYDLSKLEPEDYEEAMKEIEAIKRWAEGNETTREKLVEVLKSCGLFGAIGILTTIPETLIFGNNVPLPAQGVTAVATAAIMLKTGVFSPISRREEAKTIELSNLKEETSERLEAEKKFKVD